MTELTCLACQIDIPAMSSGAQRDQHLQRVAALIDKTLARQPVDLVVLPELTSIDYSRDSFSQLNALAEPVDGASYQVWSALARRHNVTVVYGFAQTVTNGYTIASAVVDSTGKQIAVYHKLHLAQFGDSMEKEYFIAGHQRLAVFEINGFTLAPIICYDIRMPELCRTLALDHGVDVILHTGAYARDPSFYSWHAFATTRAIENQLYFVSLNRAGAHFGGSLVCPPWIDEVHQPVVFNDHDEELRLVTIRRDALLNARADYTFLQDRLPRYDLPVDGVNREQ